ncbi:MAG: type II toxin-antitoxin system RelE/ParE family toxin [Gammaproteobacteria bacterium]|nr:type II toxin-antitoxin system RelE/ParE family toxin [Gammaproteobacteria bacterium]MBU1777059.1 type II toxin-antitoxin system RelE/ParE family toxin [Gammaproteobacteria bacterium]MBU1969148.1 type II toxin-antitoxin system RelE/ParE family toxin [Gammaproteobacteria bacterium]
MSQETNRPILSRQAEADVDAAVEWYIDEGAYTAADDFLDEIERAMGVLAQFPKVGEAGAYNTRLLPLNKFPYSLIYRLPGDVVRIIAVAHHSRRPVYWAGRR